MPLRNRWTTSLVTIFAIATLGATPGNRPQSQWARISPTDGRLVMTEDEKGNRIPDFSHCGYGGGGVRIPDVPVRMTLAPSGQDDTARIQEALDRIGAMRPGLGGFRGALLLRRGTYRVEGTLHLNHSGVVLRGEGMDQTILLATGTEQRTLITLGAKGNPREVPRSRRTIVDPYVPLGAYQVTVNDASAFSPGQRVIVRRASNAKWIQTLGMDHFPPRDDGQPVHPWKPGSFDLLFDRVVQRVEGNQIVLDAPLGNAIEAEFGGGVVYAYEFPQRISHVGIEDLAGVSEYDTSNREDENHAWSFIRVGAVENGWVRRISATHFAFGAVAVGVAAKWITVEDSICLDPISEIRGSRRYPFHIAGQLSLVQRCYARQARHDYATSSRVAGPNVFLDCFAEQSHNDTGPHHRWASAMLYDNVRVPDAHLNVQDRGNLGSGHGWAGANHVLWNCQARVIVCQMPPTAHNWAIGCVGRRERGRLDRPPGHWEHHSTPVAPVSLYLKQLEDRLGPQAIRNIAGERGWSFSR